MPRPSIAVRLATFYYGPLCRSLNREYFCEGRTKNASGYCNMCMREFIAPNPPSAYLIKAYTFYSIARI